MADTPIKYIVKEKSLIGNEIFEAGAEVALPEGTWPGSNLEAICARGVAKFAEHAEMDKARIAKLNADFGEKGLTGDVNALAKLMAAAVAEALANQAVESKPAKKAKADHTGDATLA